MAEARKSLEDAKLDFFSSEKIPEEANDDQLQLPSTVHQAQQPSVQTHSPKKSPQELSQNGETTEDYEFQHMHSAMGENQLNKLMFQIQTDDKDEQRDVDQYFENLRKIKEEERIRENQELDAELLEDAGEVQHEVAPEEDEHPASK